MTLAVVRARVRQSPLAVLVALVYLTVLVVVGSPVGAGITIATHVAMVMPGLAIMAAVAPGNRLAMGTFGPMLGFGLTAAALAACWSLGMRSHWLLLLAPAATASLAWPLRRLRDRWRLAEALPADRRAWLLVLLIVPLVVARPFARVGEMRPEGQVYRSYFTADYVWRRAVVAELAKGDFPPKNPYFLDDTLHYYWVGHLADAIEYRAFGDTVSLDAVLLGTSVAVDAAFVSAIYGLARLVVAVPWAAAGGVLWVFFLTSFEGAAGLWHWWHGTMIYRLRDLNIDAVSRWLYGGMPIDGLHRILWYQPHHATAYALGATAFVAAVRRRQRQDPDVFLAVGVLMGICMLISSFVALMFAAAVALYEIVGTVRWRAWWAGIVNGAWAALPVSIALVAVTMLQYIDHQLGALPVLRLGLNEMAIINPWVVTPLSMGPVLAMGIAGAWTAWRQRVGAALPFAALVVTAVYFYFYVDVRDHQAVYVGWRVGHVLFITLAPLVALALVALSVARGRWRWAAWTVVGLLAVLAAPMPILDAFNTQDVENQTPGPGFDYTLVLTRPELQGLAWIRTHTGAQARVQVDPYARDSNTWAYIPAFAERRMAVGLPLGLVPLRKYQEASKRVRWLYQTPDPFGAFELAARVGIDYIVVGPPERRDHPGVEVRYASASHLLPMVFHNDALSIYEVLRPGHVR